MCLSTVTRTFDPNDDFVVGYKVYKQGKNDQWVVQEHRHGKHCIGKDYPAKGAKIRSGYWGGCTPYDAGFHIFATIKGAKKWMGRPYYQIWEVHGWDVRAQGTQQGYKTYVTKNIRVVRRID